MEKIYTKEQAIEKAFIDLRKKLDIVLEDCELISKSVAIECDETGVKLKCKLYCIEDIAKKQEIKIN